MRYFAVYDDGPFVEFSHRDAALEHVSRVPGTVFAEARDDTEDVISTLYHYGLSLEDLDEVK